MNKRDELALALMIQDQQDHGPTLTPEEEERIFGRALEQADPEQARWSQQFRNQMPAELHAPSGSRDKYPNLKPDVSHTPEPMPGVYSGLAKQPVAPMPNYANTRPSPPPYNPQSLGGYNKDFPPIAEPYFEGQLSGEVPQEW